MQRLESAHGLQLYDEDALDDEVETIGAPEPDTAIRDAQRRSSCTRQTR